MALLAQMRWGELSECQRCCPKHMERLRPRHTNSCRNIYRPVIYESILFSYGHALCKFCYPASSLRGLHHLCFGLLHPHANSGAAGRVVGLLALKDLLRWSSRNYKLRCTRLFPPSDICLAAYSRHHSHGAQCWTMGRGSKRRRLSVCSFCPLSPDRLTPARFVFSATGHDYQSDRGVVAPSSHAVI